MAIKRQGQRLKIRVDLNGSGGASAIWAVLPLRKKFTLKKGITTEDTSTADDGGWDVFDISGAGQEISVDFLCDPASPIYQYLESWYDSIGADHDLWIQIDKSAVGGIKQEAKAVITDWSEDWSNKTMASGTITFKLSGALATSTSSASPSASISSSPSHSPSASPSASSSP